MSATIVRLSKRLEPPFDVSVPAPTPGSDDALVEAERRRAAAEAWFESLKGKSDDQVDAFADVVNLLDDFIAEAPAVGPLGIAIKFRRVCEHVNVYGNSTWGSDLERTILEALDRLAAGHA